MKVSVCPNIENSQPFLCFKKKKSQSKTMITIFTNYPHWFQASASEVNFSFFFSKQPSRPGVFLVKDKEAFVDKSQLHSMALSDSYFTKRSFYSSHGGNLGHGESSHLSELI